MDERKWQRKEWIYILVLVSLIQAIIWYVSFVYAANSTALGYVSFAGTIISIILAVLAIGYTYGESIKQKNSSDTVVNQISRLNEVIKTIQLEASSLEKISTISDELERLSSTFSEGMTGIHETNKEVQNLSSLIESNFSNNNKKNDTPNNQVLDKSYIAKLLTKKTILGIELTFVLLKYYHKKQIDKNIALVIIEQIESFRKEFDKIDTEKKLSVIEMSVLTGSAIAAIRILEYLELINTSDNIFEVSPELLTEIQEFIASPSDYKNIYQPFLDFILKEVDIDNKK